MLFVSASHVHSSGSRSEVAGQKDMGATGTEWVDSRQGNCWVAGE